MRRTFASLSAVVAVSLVGVLSVASAAGAAPDSAFGHIATLGSFDGAAVSAGRVAYSDAVGGDWDVYVRGASAERPVRITGEGDQMTPDISGSVVVFVDYSRGDADIRGYDLIQRRSFDICNQPGNQVRPRISGDWVVWLELGSGSTGKVNALNIRTGEQVAVAASNASNAAIGGSLVVYEDYSDTGADIRAFDLESATAQVVAADAQPEVLPSTDGDWVFWATTGKDGTFDVKGVQLSTGGTAQIAGAGEQTSPVVEGGRVYAIDRTDGRAMRVVATPLPGSSAVRETYSRSGDVVAFDAEGDNLVWVSGTQGEWRISAEIGLSRSARVAEWLRGAWSRIAPVEYASWADTEQSMAGAVNAEKIGAIRAPGAVTARIITDSQVKVAWRAPYASVGVANYDVYRFGRPINTGNLASATKIASAITTITYTDTISPSTDTTIKAGSYYYAVVARDNEAIESPISASVSPNPHGATVYGGAVNGCLMCHDLHGSTVATEGALGAASAAGCYDCHGGTGGTSAYGAGALNDIQADFAEDSAVATQGPSTPSGGSIHRNTTMVQRQNECSACHNSHRRSYTVTAAGAYDAAASYSKSLRAQLTTTPADTFAEWPDTAPAGNAICLSCHGSSATPMSIAGGATAYSQSGGNHESSGGRTYNASAHGPSTVTSTTAIPGTQCEVCHNQHSSATARLVDYRNSGTTNPNANKQGNLCTNCHNSTTPAAWNGRVVPTEFTRASSHPSVATTAAGVASATCVSCHNTHFVQTGGAGSWATARVSSPTNTGATATDSTTFCLGCHTGSAGDGSITIAKSWSSSTLIPYQVFMRPSTTWPFFSGWNKDSVAGGAITFTGSGHYNATAANGKALCETCHDPHGSDFGSLTAWYSGGQSWSAGTPNAALRTGNLSTNASNRSAAFGKSVSFEEALCLQCHGAAAAGTSRTIKDEAAANVTVTVKKSPGAQNIETGMFSTVYVHGIQSFGGRHSNTETAANLVGNQASRHVECGDCHDPHAARNNGTPGQAYHVAGSSIAGNALRGATGLIPAWTSTKYDGTNGAVRAADGTPKRFDGTAAGSNGDYEAYLCFKCHAGDANGGRYTVTTGSGLHTATNVAAEFNPVNESGHNVLGAQTTWPKTSVATGILLNNWNFPTTNVFRTGWTVTSKVTCTDCHTYEAAGGRGPHGGANAYMVPSVDGAYVRYYNNAFLVANTYGMSPGTICSKCHDLYDGATWGNTVHAEHVGRVGNNQCSDCHTKIPHGWRRPRLLGYTSDPAPYNSNNLTGFTRTVSGTDRNYPEDWAVKDNCGQSGCASHNATPQGTAYP